MINQVVLKGFVSGQPRVSEGQFGTIVMFNISHPWTAGENKGYWKISCMAGKFATATAQLLKDGDMVLVMGKLKSYKDKTTGYDKMSFSAEDIYLATIDKPAVLPQEELDLEDIPVE